MARKKRRKRESSFRIPYLKRGVTGLLAVVMLAVGNWFAHLPTETRAKAGSLEPLLETVGSLTADWTDALGLTGRDVAVPYLTAVPKQGPLPFGEPQVVDTKKCPDDIVLLKRKGYWAGWSPSLRHPVWVAYAVPTKKLLNYPPERPPFERDEGAPQSSSPEDYIGTGYDRGHMAPNYLIATRYGKAAQKETFLMSNIVPQMPDLNRGPWRKLEQVVADDLSGQGDVLWVITGAVPDRTTRLGHTRVRIPKGFYKIVATVRAERLQVIGVYMPQATRTGKEPRYCFRSIDALEELTGLDFFSVLSKARQAELEAPEASRFWSCWGVQ